MGGRFNLGEDVLPSDLLEGEAGPIGQSAIDHTREDQHARAILKTGENQLSVVRVACASEAVCPCGQGFAFDPNS